MAALNMAKSNEGQVAIITVTYNASDFIFEYLKSLKALIMFDERFSAVIVDNSSSDGTQKLISDYIVRENLSKKFICMPLIKMQVLVLAVILAHH